MKDIKRILAICGTVSDCGETVHYAATLARDTRAELVVLTVVYNPFGVKGLSLPRPSLEKDYQQLLRKIKSDMQVIINRETQQGIAIEHMVREGKPVNDILEVIREKEIDLMVLPAHEEARLEHFLFGGKNKELLRKIPCSILFIKSEPIAVEDEEEKEEEWGAGAAIGEVNG